MNPMPLKTYLDDREVSVLTGISRRTLQNWRWLRKGFPYLKVGRRCLYYKPDIEQYMSECKIRVAEHL